MRILLNRTYTTTDTADITGGIAHGALRCANALTTDSREVERGDIFVALRGENFDGHRYLSEAMARGAAFLITEEEPTAPYPSVCVKDSYAALTALAREVRERVSPTVIAVTGSVGKTTAKNMIAAVLSTCFRVHKTDSGSRLPIPFAPACTNRRLSAAKPEKADFPSTSLPYNAVI